MNKATEIKALDVINYKRAGERKFKLGVIESVLAAGEVDNLNPIAVVIHNNKRETLELNAALKWSLIKL